MPIWLEHIGLVQKTSDQSGTDCARTSFGEPDCPRQAKFPRRIGPPLRRPVLSRRTSHIALFSDVSAIVSGLRRFSPNIPHFSSAVDLPSDSSNDRPNGVQEMCPLYPIIHLLARKSRRVLTRKRVLKNIRRATLGFWLVKILKRVQHSWSGLRRRHRGKAGGEFFHVSIVVYFELFVCFLSFCFCLEERNKSEPNSVR